MDMVVKGHASYSPANDKRALCVFVMIWIVYSRFHARGSFFDTYPNSSSSYAWSSCWSTLGAIVMASKTMNRLESKKSHSWWFGSLKTSSNWEATLVLELQNQIARLRFELEKNKSFKGVTADAFDLIADVSGLASMVKKRLDEEGRLKIEKHCLAEEEVAKLRLELIGTKSFLKVSETQTAVLTEQNRMLDVNISQRDVEITELKAAISSAELKFKNEKFQLQKVILALQQGQAELETKLRHSESKVRKLVEAYKKAECEHNEFRVLQRNHEAELETILRHSESKVHKLVEAYKKAEGEHSEFRVLQRNREAEMRIEITEMERYVKAKIVEKEKQVEELNNNLDELKVNFDALRAERDELDAKVTSLATDLVSRDERICQMEEHLIRLHNEHVDMISKWEGARKQAEERKIRLRRMEREVEWQRDMITEGAEEKREAIRQLCFSLEHYKNRYYEFRKAFVELTKQAPVQDIAYYYRK